MGGMRPACRPGDARGAQRAEVPWARERGPGQGRLLLPVVRRPL